MKLYSYWRSSASYRVRIALNLKGLSAEVIPVNLLKHEQRLPDYLKLNPQGRVPSLLDGGELLTQSLAIIEYLEEKFPEPPLLPANLAARAHARALAYIIASDIAPLNNLGPMQFLEKHFGLSPAQKNEWYQHWIASGFKSLETLLSTSPYTGSYCLGATPGLADCVLIPQLYNARRYDVDLMPYPTLTRIEAQCAAHQAFIAAHPSQQRDAK